MLQTNQVAGARRLAGFPIIGNPTVILNTLQFDATLNAFVWVAASTGGGNLVKVGEDVLAAPGTSLLVDGLSIELDPDQTSTNVGILVKWNIFGITTKIITAIINGGTQFTGERGRMNASAFTVVAYTNTADIPINAGINSTVAGSGTMEIGAGEETTGETLKFLWRHQQDNDNVTAGGKLVTTKSTIFTGIEIIGSGNMGVGSILTVYRISR